MKYKISLRNHLKALEFLIIVSFLMLAFVLYDKYYSEVSHPRIEYDILVFWLISALPVIYLHIEYYWHNRGSMLEIDAWEKTLVYTNKFGVSETYSFEDLSKIIVKMPPNMYRGSGFQALPFEQYHHAKIFTKSGKEIIVTCLMARKVMNVVNSISGVPVEKEKQLFASVLIG
jgi:hypothetical protein